MKRWIFLLLMALATGARGQASAVPERPADHILDETRTVTPAERVAVAAEMDLVAAKTGIGVYLVLLNTVPEERPADFARRLAEHWKGHADRAVLVSGPGMSPPLVIAVAGESLVGAQEAELEAIKTGALEAGARATPGLPALLEVARNIISRVVIFRGRGNPGPVLPPAPERSTYLAAWIAGGSLVCCAVVLLLRRRGRRSALIFPPTQFRQRFSAPHSGGNDAVVFFGKP